MTLLRAMWRLLQARLLQAVRGATPAEGRWPTLAPLLARVTPLQAI
jgi:hypothetical protein